jgi:hypothetical protein
MHTLKLPSGAINFFSRLPELLVIIFYSGAHNASAQPFSVLVSMAVSWLIAAFPSSMIL